MKRPPQFDQLLETYEELKLNSTKKFSDYENAVVLIVEFQLAIEAGNRHFDSSGKELTTVGEILLALRRDKHISIEPSQEGWKEV